MATTAAPNKSPKSRFQPWKPSNLAELSDGLKHLDDELQAAAKHFYTEQGMQEAAKSDSAVYHALNRNAEFWTVPANAMHTAFFMAISRVMDDAPDAITLRGAIRHSMANRHFFSIAGCQDDDIRRAVESLQAALDPIAAEWEERYGVIRDWIHAHSILARRPGGVADAYAETSIIWIDSAIAQLEDIVQCLLDLAERATIPTVGRRGESRFKRRALDAARREMTLITTSR